MRPEFKIGSQIPLSALITITPAIKRDSKKKIKIIYFNLQSEKYDFSAS